MPALPADDAAPDLLVLTTGGTIDKLYSTAGELEIREPTVGPILEQAATNLRIAVRGVLAVDSLDMTAEHRRTLTEAVAAAETPRIVITHGTDTMTETAEHLLAHPEAIAGKTVVLTGAMQPSCMRITDAPFNVGSAVTAAQLLDPGVYIAMSGRIFPAGTVAKDRARGVFVDR